MSVPPRSKMTAFIRSALSWCMIGARGSACLLVIVTPGDILHHGPVGHIVSERPGGYAPAMWGGGPPASGISLAKALASVAGADLELENQFFNNAVNRAYYAC